MRESKTIGYDGNEGDDPWKFIIEEAGWTSELMRVVKYDAILPRLDKDKFRILVGGVYKLYAPPLDFLV